ncbi:hypothetical protein PLICRDRAFT_146714 [Plicaturopsis crispa FD-325 SS-3]|uniref:RNase III domain-containing protein n=1 Tax=Plicaturopsis crispa FD-325 SS-3 TaxID=944288 RepID=A0A0C9T5G8_PLICR|nr:hypothetical protein PLICRDRAFT_146714 [Plicaturopsis crispa FD-325 SS-3]
MSRSLRTLDSSIRALRSSSSHGAPTRTTPVSRRYINSSLRSRPTEKRPASIPISASGATRLSHSGAALETPPHQALEPRSADTRPSRKPADSTRYAEHLNGILAPLTFSPEMARRVLTHGSHPNAIDGHNGRFSFIGRRILEAYLLLFLHSAQPEGHDYAAIASSTLNTYTLGENVAPLWNLGRALRWVPTVSQKFTPTGRHAGPAAVDAGEGVTRWGPEILKSVGMYKVHGEAVQAVVGAVYHQYGGSVANRLFHTRILPNILLPGRPQGLHDAFHADALNMLHRMGGPESNLLEALPRETVMWRDDGHNIEESETVEYGDENAATQTSSRLATNSSI